MLSALSNFAQDYSYYTYSSPTADSGISGIMVAYFIALGVMAVIALVSLWKIFVKTGQPGWAAIVPVYNYLVLLKIVGRPWWWVLIMFVGVIPVVGWIVTFVIGIIVLNDLSKSFGKGPGVTALLVLVPFVGYPYLAFGDPKYHGPAALNTPGGLTGPAPSHTGGTHPAA